MSTLATPKAPQGYEMLQFPTRGGRSADIYNQLSGDVFQKLLGQAQGSPGAFAPQEQQAMDFYQRQLAPQIAQRYAGSGISGSSGMQNALASGARDVTTNLHAQRNQLMQQSMHDVLNLGNILLQNPDVENYYAQNQGMGGGGGSSIWDKLLGIGLPVVGAIGGGILGGPMGAAAGASLGGTLSSGFTGRQGGSTDWSGIASLPTKWKG